MKKILVVLGPTATGKTDLAITLAKKFSGEIVSCDSRQVYKGLDIGTGKLPGRSKNFKVEGGRWLIDGVAVHLYDVIVPDKQYNVAEYIKDANEAVYKVIRQKKLPIIVGGTGLYLKALLDGLPDLEIPISRALKEKLLKLSLDDLQKKLQSLSPIAWDNLNNSDRNNKRRLLRYIERIYMYPYKKSGMIPSPLKKTFNILEIGLTAPRRNMYKRIDLRLDLRIRQGLIEEGWDLYKKGLELDRMRQLGLEYRCLADLIEGKITKKQFRKRLSSEIHQFSKRQLTWFKKEGSVNWFDITDKSFEEKIENLVKKWYYADKFNLL